MSPKRIDVWLVEQRYAATREKAQALIDQGLVFRNGFPVVKTATQVSARDVVEIRNSREPAYVGRGAQKLANAFQAFGLRVEPDWYLDVGSSTGGFTDYLIQNGAAGVIALDVGTHQLHEKLRQHSQVMVMEQTHILDVQALPRPIHHAVIDVSFISLVKVLPKVWELLSPPRSCLALFKPQFEVSQKHVHRGGVVRDAHVAQATLDQFVSQIRATLNPKTLKTCPCGLLGKKSHNQEYWIWLCE